MFEDDLSLLRRHVADDEPVLDGEQDPRITEYIWRCAGVWVGSLNTDGDSVEVAMSRQPVAA